MTLTDDLFTMQRRITQLADVIACAIIKRQQPAADLLTKRQAYVFAGGGLGHKQGRGWIDNHIMAGRLTVTRRGDHPNSPLVLSRMEIVALHEAEILNKVDITHKMRSLKPNPDATL